MGCINTKVLSNKQIHLFQLPIFKLQVKINPECHQGSQELKSLINPRIRNAIAAYQAYLEFNQDLDLPFYGLGSVEDQVGYYQGQVCEWYTKALSSKEITINYYDALCLCYSIQKDYNRASKWYDKMLILHPENYQLCFGKANIEFNHGNYQKAEELYRNVIDINPKFDKSYQQIASIYCLKYYRNDIAKEWVKHSYKINKNNIFTRFILALVADQFDIRIKLLKKIVNIAPFYARAYNSLAITYYQCKNYSEAKLWFESAIKINPNYFSAYCGLGLTLIILGNYQESIQNSLKSIELNSKMGQSYRTIARAYWCLKDILNAIAWYQKCLLVDLKYEQVYIELCQIYIQTNKESQFVDCFTRATQNCEQFGMRNYQLEMKYESLLKMSKRQSFGDTTNQNFSPKLNNQLEYKQKLCKFQNEKKLFKDECQRLKAVDNIDNLVLAQIDKNKTIFDD